MSGQAASNSKYVSYPDYKDSGVEWLGEVPVNWGVFQGKRVFMNRKESALSDDAQLAASQAYGVIPQSLLIELTGSKVMLALKGTDSFRHVSENDFVISLRSFEGGIEHSAYIGCVSPAYTVLSAVIPIHPWFYRYLLKCKPYVSALQASTDSLRDGKSITFEQFGSIRLPAPPLEEQRTIAAFLDYETARIDSLIDKQQRLIELLKEKRQAVISHAVTKGLNPDAPMKDSGVEWLGQVPEHWGVMRLKQVLSSPMMYGANEAALDDNPDNPRFIRITDMNADGTLKQSTFKSLEPNVAKPYLLKDKDLLLARSGATVGKSFLYKAEYGTACFAGYLIKAELDKSKLLPEYAYLYSQSIPYWEFITGNQIQATIQNVSAEKYGNLFIPIPSIDEQLESIHYLQTAIQTFADFESKAQLAIELMQERRTALISAAVTGKIDLRGWTPPVREDAA
ncbi:restriction endonuclease subunit S [Shewanella algae]|uniref:restriction endonuclease subunit S n=1 Tax=Shewanella algae TaxID=38313 RepID=UPI0031F5D076